MLPPILTGRNAMWTTNCEKLPDTLGLRFSIARAGQTLSFADVVGAWQNDAGYCEMFNGLLAEAPFEAFRWESPGMTAETMSQPYQFVLLDSPGLASRPVRAAFAEHFDKGINDVVAFKNLSGGATMVVPCPVAEDEAYGHLAAFVRLAPAHQRRSLWQAVGREMAHRVSAKAVWLSTAGAGVSWLHVRLDDRPKYYGYAPFRNVGSSTTTKTT
jgi:hypothetical protein